MKKQLISLLTACAMVTGMAVSVQAKAATTVWVVTQHKQQDGEGNMRYFTYSYDQHGLLKRERFRIPDIPTINEEYDYSYDRNGHIRQKREKKAQLKKITYKTNKKGLVREATNFPVDGKNYRISYSYNKKGLIIGEKDSSGGKPASYRYNRKGQRINGYESTFRYDKNGYIYKIKHADQTIGTRFYKNRYSNNGLISSVFQPYRTRPDTYRYKKIKISAKYASEIRRQQDALTSRNGYLLAYIDINDIY